MILHTGMLPHGTYAHTPARSRVRSPRRVHVLLFAAGIILMIAHTVAGRL